jgi:syntaxin 1B/2/3
MTYVSARSAPGAPQTDSHTRIQMSVLVEQQDEQITTIEATAATVEMDMETGVGYQEKAIVSAKSARKGRWICFGISAVVLIIIVIVIITQLHLGGGGSSKPASTATVTASGSAPAATASKAARAIAGRLLMPAPTPPPV